MRKSPDRPGDFIREARRLFAGQGYGITTIDDIVSAVGVGKGTFYSYFTNKSDLLIRLLHQSFAELATRMQTSRRRAKDPESQLAAAFRTHIEHFRSQPDLIRILEEVKIHFFDTINQLFVQTLEEEIHFLIKMITDRQKKKLWRKIHPTNLLLSMMLTTHALLFKEVRFGQHITEREIRELLDLFLHGLRLAPPPRPSRRPVKEIPS